MSALQYGVGGFDRFRSPSGFTLMEMMIALTIGALLVAVVAPNMGPLFGRAQLYSAARDVASGLRFARGQAISSGREGEFEIDVEHHRYRVSGRNKVYGLADSVHISLFAADTDVSEDGRGKIRFFPDGSSTGGRITLESAGLKRFVDVVWLTGEVRLRESEGED